MALLGVGSNLIKGLNSRALLCVNNVCPIFSATIVSKALRQPTCKPAPYPYREKKYPVWMSWIDKTTHRLDENSKLIVVDGPPCCGKTEFAKKLAEELDFFYISDGNMDIKYTSPYGYDMRQLDPQLPEEMKSFDEKKFNENPFHCNVAAFQLWKYRLRYSLYIDALAHILSTGQGVVIQRSPWSDMAFVEAMRKNKYISKEAYFVYTEVKRSCIQMLMKPHLVIYLDVPVKTVQENIKKRNRPFEQNPKALTTTFLQDVEDYYKTHYLPDITCHAELLMYDWTKGGDVEIVVEDIEEIDFEKYGRYDSKMGDWCMLKERFWAEKRKLYADKKQYLLRLLYVPIFDAPELISSGEDHLHWYHVWHSAPGMKYEKGFNTDQGDQNLWFKSKSDKYIRF